MDTNNTLLLTNVLLIDAHDHPYTVIIHALDRESFAEARAFLKHFEESHAADGRY